MALNSRPPGRSRPGSGKFQAGSASSAKGRSHLPSAHKKSKDRPVLKGAPRPKKHKVNGIKSRIRDLQRLLRHADNLPADIRLGHERELASCRHDLAIEVAEIRKQQLISKYHMVRFFDRQKAQRQLKKISKAYDQCEDEAERKQLEVRKHMAEVDVNYAIYYPLTRPYCALYPTKKDTGNSDKGTEEAVVSSDRGDQEMWKAVEEAMAEGSLAALRNSQPIPLNLAPLPVATAPPVAKKKKVERRPKRRGDEEDEEEPNDDEDSDGGFFEHTGSGHAD